MAFNPLAGVNKIMAPVNNFVTSNAASLGMVGLGADLVSSARQVRLNEKVYRLQKAMLYRGTQIRKKDLMAAGINPILAGVGALGSFPSIQAPNVGMDVGSKMNNAMAFAQQAAALKNAQAQTKAIEAQTKSQVLDNENKENLVNYQNGKYDRILNNPFELALNDLSTGYKDEDRIIADLQNDVRSGLISQSLADSVIDYVRNFNKTKQLGHGRITKTTRDRFIPFSVRRQYDLDRLALAGNKTALEQQILQNFLTSYNARTLPSETNQQALNNILPWLSNATNWLPYLEKAFKFFKKGGKK